MPKYCVKNYFTHGRFPEVGQKQKTEKKKKKERAKVGDNNGQAMHGARKHAWRTQAAWAKIFAGRIFLSMYIYGNKCAQNVYTILPALILLV